MRGKTIAGLILLALISGCASEQDYHPAPGQRMHISEKTMAGYKEYLAEIGSINPGVFAVSSSGRMYEFYYCQENVCSDGNAFAAKALHGCEMYGEKCYVFAKNRDIKVDYDIVP